MPFHLTLGEIHGKSAAGGFFVFLHHVAPGFLHGLDDLVERDEVLAIGVHGEAGGVDGLDGGHGVAFDAGDLHEPADGVAGEAEVVFHADLGSVFDLLRGAAEVFDKGTGGHRAGHADFALATDVGTGDGGVFFV